MLDISGSFSQGGAAYHRPNGSYSARHGEMGFTSYVESMTNQKEHTEESLGYTPICNKIDPDKVDDVLTPSTRYQLTEEDKVYFQEKYGDVNQLSYWEMDCMLYELQEMGVITQSERLEAHPLFEADGSFAPGRVTCLAVDSYTVGEVDFGDDVFAYFQEKLESLRKEIFTMGLTAEEIRENKEAMKRLDAVSSVLEGIFGKTTGSSVGAKQTPEIINALADDMEREVLFRELLYMVSPTQVLPLSPEEENALI